jgi:hypothetical protein
MQIANGADPTGGTWETYVASKAWTLAAGDGAKTVSARYRSFEGVHSGIATATTTLDAETGVSGYSGAMQNMRILIASSATFQALVGVADYLSALPYVYRWYVSTPGSARPFCIVDEVPEEEDDWLADHCYTERGAFIVIFQGAVTKTNAAGATVYKHADVDWRGQGIVFKNTVDAIRTEIKALAGQDRGGSLGSYLCLKRIHTRTPLTTSTASEWPDQVYHEIAWTAGWQ